LTHSPLIRQRVLGCATFSKFERLGGVLCRSSPLRYAL